MTTFAETNISFADGQRNVEPFPQEMGFYGFIPPVRSAGSPTLTKGDVLTAQWLNAIFRDCFRAQTQIQEFDIPDNVSAVAPAAAKIGVLTWITLKLDVHDKPNGEVVFPPGYVFATPPLVLPLNVASDANGARTIAYDVTGTGFRVRVAAPGNTEDDTSYGNFNTFLVIGETSGPVPAPPETGIFAEYQRVYVDGQTTWTAPSADQYNLGFIPTYLNATGELVEGDQLAANVLNFVLCDLFRKGGRGYTTVKTHQDEVTGDITTTPAYIIQAGPFKIQLWRDKVRQGGDRLQFPEPFRQGTAPALFASLGSLQEGDPVSALAFISTAPNTTDPNNINAWSGRVVAWNNAATPLSIDADVIMMAVGFADRPVSLQRYYLDFAATPKTYPDGQTNTVTIDPDIMQHGFKPPVLNADGTVTPGDVVRAQEINTLFNLAYQDAATGLDIMSGLLVESVAANGWSTVENSAYFLSWRVMTGAAWAAGQLSFAPPVTVKAGSVPVVFAMDLADNDPANITPKTSTTAAQIDLQAMRHAALDQPANPARFNVFVFGVKG